MERGRTRAQHPKKRKRGREEERKKKDIRKQGSKVGGAEEHVHGSS